MSGHIFIISRLVKPESEQRLGMLKFCLELLKKNYQNGKHYLAFWGQAVTI